MRIPGLWCDWMPNLKTLLERYFCRDSPRVTRWFVWIAVFIFACLFLCACGSSQEERQRRKEIADLGEQNVIHYIESKYDFTPEIIDIEICINRNDNNSFLSANGYVLATVSYKDKIFKVQISGERSTLEGMDDFQYEIITKEAKEYFEALLGYEIYDVYLEYKENNIFIDLYQDDLEKNVIHEWYEVGNFESFLQHYPTHIRIDDCTNKDLTTFLERNPDTTAFFEEYAEDYKMKVILISYKSFEAYENGYEHTYGRGGVMDFDIWKDGVYICSYAVFDEQEVELNRFEQQEYDGMIFSCVDQKEGEDLVLLSNEHEWMELGETFKEPLSKVYSITTDQSGEVAVYIPVEKLRLYKKATSVYIQHFYEGKWWQYETNVSVTKDRKYKIVVYHGVDNGSFDFAIFE